MEVYDVLVFDTNWNVDNPDDWTMESPPTRVSAMDSYSAALMVAGRELEGMRRPRGWTGMLFWDRGMGLVFHVEDTGERAGPNYRAPEYDEIQRMRTSKGEKEVKVRRLGPNIWEEV